MKVAIIGSVISTMPSSKGTVHAPLKLTFELARGLVNKGHEVVYFGLINRDYQSLMNFKYDELGYEVKYNFTDPLRSDFFIVYEQGFMSRALERAKGVDLVYTPIAYRMAPLARLASKPIVATHHDASNMHEYNPMFRSCEADNLYIIPVSHYLDNQLSYGNKLGVVHNGLDIGGFPNSGPEDYFCWVGRVVPSKGLHIAIELAKKTGIKLKIAGPMAHYLDTNSSQGKYLEDIKREIDANANIEYVGVLNQEETYALFSKAKAFIFPTDGQESFSLVTIEAMLSGTPVIATKAGPLPELVKEGIGGYLCEGEDEFIQAIKNIDKIDRAKCRKYAQDNFSSDKMVDGYEARFNEVLAKFRKGR